MEFKNELEKLNIALNDSQLNKLESYYKKLVEVNEYMNLTAITEHDEVYIKHFLDSLSLAKAIDLNKEASFLDVGSGAGFPSVPLAIASNNIKVTIIDALNKRINFLNDLACYLELDNVTAIHTRAEDFAKTKRESFDYVSARAVARLNVLAELCLPLCKVGGVFIAMKSQSYIEELNEADKAIKTLGGNVSDIIEYDLPDEMGKRYIIIINKVKSTPEKYPRAFAKIKERPL